MLSFLVVITFASKVKRACVEKQGNLHADRKMKCFFCKVEMSKKNIIQSNELNEIFELIGKLDEMRGNASKEKSDGRIQKLEEMYRHLSKELENLKKKSVGGSSTKNLKLDNLESTQSKIETHFNTDKKSSVGSSINFVEKSSELKREEKTKGKFNYGIVSTNLSYHIQVS